MANKKTYIGDGLYAQDFGYQISLTAENGIEVLEEIYLDDRVLEDLFRFIEQSRGVRISVRKRESELVREPI